MWKLLGQSELPPSHAVLKRFRQLGIARYLGSPILACEAHAFQRNREPDSDRLLVTHAPFTATSNNNPLCLSNQFPSTSE